MDFIEFIEQSYDRVGDIGAPFVIASSIEAAYARSVGANLGEHNAVFINWINAEQAIEYPTICAIHDRLMLGVAEVDNELSTNKLGRLVRLVPRTGQILVHPMVAVYFALQISPAFAAYVLDRIHVFLPMRQVDLDTRSTIADRFHAEIDDQNMFISNLRHEIHAKDAEIARLNDENSALSALIIRRRPGLFSRLMGWLARCCLPKTTDPLAESRDTRLLVLKS